MAASQKTETIRSRRSVRAYLKESIPADVIDDILDCGRLAPTARNLQPWLIGAITDKELLRKLAGLADHGAFIADAAACFAVFAKRDEKYRLEDGAAATMNVLHAAHAHGLGACWVAGDKKPYAEDVRKLLNVAEDFTLISLVSAGYPAEAPQARGKKALSEVSFKDICRL